MAVRVAIGPSSFAEVDGAPLEALKQAGVEVVPNPYGRRLTEEEIASHLTEVDGLIAGLEPLTRGVLSGAERLKAIARVGIGMSNVDLEAARDLGIKVSNTPDAPAQAVAELTLTALLALLRKVTPANEALHRGDWVKMIGRGIQGLKILIVGYGRIGRRVADLLEMLGAEILIADPFIADEAPMTPHHFVPLEKGLPEADVISLHASGVEVLLGKDEFELMKEGVILLNSARGELVDENSLIQALEQNRIQSAWFDAFWEEPYAGRLIEFENVLLTPHMGTYTVQCRRDMETTATRNLLRDLGMAKDGLEG